MCIIHSHHTQQFCEPTTTATLHPHHTQTAGHVPTENNHHGAPPRRRHRPKTVAFCQSRSRPVSRKSPPSRWDREAERTLTLGPGPIPPTESLHISSVQKASSCSWSVKVGRFMGFQGGMYVSRGGVPFPFRFGRGEVEKRRIFSCSDLTGSCI